MEAVQRDKQHYRLQPHTSTCTSKAALLVRWPKEALRGKCSYRLQSSKLWENGQRPSRPDKASNLGPAHSLDGW